MGEGAMGKGATGRGVMGRGVTGRAAIPVAAACPHGLQVPWSAWPGAERPHEGIHLQSCGDLSIFIKCAFSAEQSILLTGFY